VVDDLYRVDLDEAGAGAVPAAGYYLIDVRAGEVLGGRVVSP
jgi:hypothetical protein